MLTEEIGNVAVETKCEYFLREICNIRVHTYVFIRVLYIYTICISIGMVIASGGGLFDSNRVAVADTPTQLMWV